MGRLLSTKNLALPGANGYVLKGNTDGTQEWAASSGISSITSYLPILNCDSSSTTYLILNNFNLQIDGRSSDVDLANLVVTARDGDIPINTTITAAS